MTMLTWTVWQRAAVLRRNPSPRYRSNSADELARHPELLAVLPPGEDVVGYYENEPEKDGGELLVITNRSICIVRDRSLVDTLAFVDVHAIRSHHTLAPPQLVLERRDGTEMAITVAGVRGKIKDVFLMHGFFNYVIADARRAKADDEGKA